MSYYNRVQSSIDYIEENIENEIALYEAANVACCSLYHFYRIFKSMVGHTVKDYIRKRRIACAAEELCDTNIKIIDIALKYQYKTHESFSRAFFKEVGVLPNKYRNNSYEKYTFEKVNIYNRIFDSILHDDLIGPEVIVKDDLTVVGFELHTTKRDEIDFKEITRFWKRFANLGMGEKIQNKIYSSTYIGYSYDFDEEANYTYLLGSVVSKLESLPKNMTTRVIPASKYIKFHVKDCNNLVNTWRYIYNSWLPKSGLELVDNTDFEVIDLGKEKTEAIIYLPVK